jgi:hypothetical protein
MIDELYLPEYNISINSEYDNNNCRYGNIFLSSLKRYSNAKLLGVRQEYDTTKLFDLIKSYVDFAYKRQSIEEICEKI